MKSQLRFGSMQANLKMRVEYQQPAFYEAQVPFINVLPSEPLEAYKRFDQKQLQGIKKTQKIPFPSIRQLILIYVLQNQHVFDVVQSELFKQKLLDSKYQRDHLEVNKIYDELLKQRSRLQKLYEVTHMYIERRQKLVGNQLRRTIGNIYDSSELNSRLGVLDKKKDDELRKLQRKIQQALKQKVIVDIQKQKMQIQQGYNRGVLELFEEQTPKLQKRSAQFREMFENINFFKLFIDDFEKSLIFIISTKKINNKTIYKVQERLLKDIFEVQLLERTKQLSNYLEHELEEMFQWRARVKYGAPELRQSLVKEKHKELIEIIHQKIYEQIPHIISILKSDKQTIKTSQSEVVRQYSNFLPGLYDAMEVSLFYKKQSKIQQILYNEKQLLISHLKKNYSMMVHYSKSSNYMTCIEEYRSKSKGYLKDILKNKVGLLDEAISFINSQYVQLYKDACDGRRGTRQKILQKCKSLEQNLKQDQTILSLILQSCRRLLNIVNN